MAPQPSFSLHIPFFSLIFGNKTTMAFYRLAAFGTLLTSLHHSCVMPRRRLTTKRKSSHKTTKTNLVDAEILKRPNDDTTGLTEMIRQPRFTYGLFALSFLNLIYFNCPGNLPLGLSTAMVQLGTSVSNHAVGERVCVVGLHLEPRNSNSVSDWQEVHGSLGLGSWTEKQGGCCVLLLDERIARLENGGSAAQRLASELAGTYNVSISVCFRR